MDIEKLNEAIRTIRDFCKKSVCDGCPLGIQVKNLNFKECALLHIPEMWKEL